MKGILRWNVLMFFLWFGSSGGSCTKTNSQTPPSGVNDSTVLDQPILTGRLIYHSYSCYDCNDSQLFLVDFSTKQRILLNANWELIHPMNAHFSPDGQRIVFMAIDAISHSWDVYIYRLKSNTLPYNLTASSGMRDEDPKFSPNGNQIVFKQNGQMKIMDTLGQIIQTLHPSQVTASMPYFIQNSQQILYAGSETMGSTTDIFLYQIHNASIRPLSATPGLEEYYPIAINDTSFYFTRWVSSSNQNDQIYLGFTNGLAAQSLPFNDTHHNYSDAFPVNDSLVFLSTTQAGGLGGYDLILANSRTGQKWLLNTYLSGINSSKEELGACYIK